MTRAAYSVLSFSVLVLLFLQLLILKHAYPICRDSCRSKNRERESMSGSRDKFFRERDNLSPSDEEREAREEAEAWGLREITII